MQDVSEVCFEEVHFFSVYLNGSIEQPYVVCMANVQVCPSRFGTLTV